ncbi:hypothetical protein Moror_2501 [Moniliophthora roreri MCA 2997]|uniref:Uncharacterized protein n=2 Tax=Moniliophthora roreri TaxID=221103 RepID=V2WXI1_MONRO|nr:hypothetical protein Moror_2501 [Moniliophthora roreri MCA 2997]
MSRQNQSIKLPIIGDDDSSEGEEGPLKSIPESLVLLQSLRQSREKILSSFFTKFSGKQHKKTTNPTPILPHTIQSRGKCDLSIGPHVFHDTVIYEVHYLQTQAQQPQQSQPRQWQSYYPNSNYQAAPVASASTAQSQLQIPTDTVPSSQPAPMMSALTITPEVVNQVNLAASTNPTLANLLQLAAAGKASTEQLKTLGLLIQSLAANAYTTPVQPPSTNSPATSSTSASTTTLSTSTALPTQAQAPNLKPFDVVFEFRENISERWIMPRGLADFSTVSSMPNSAYSSSMSSDNSILITTIAPKTQGENSTGNEELTTIHISKAPWTIRDTVQRWAGGCVDEETQAILDKLKTEQRHGASSVKLAHQIAEDSPLLAQLQAITAPPYTLKSIKPTGNTTTTTRKRATTRKPKATPAPPVPSPAVPLPPEAAVAATITPTIIPTPPPPTTDVAASASPMANVATSTSSLPTSNTEPLPKKQRQPRQPKARQPQTPRAPIIIKCLSCGMTDVPLLMGGRFCRPCVSAGKANAEIPQVASSRGQGMSSYRTSTATTPAWVASASATLSTIPSTSPTTGDLGAGLPATSAPNTTTVPVTPVIFGDVASNEQMSEGSASGEVLATTRTSSMQSGQNDTEMTGA